MTQLEKSVFGAGFVSMTEDELYEVNGGRWFHHEDGLRDTTTVETSTTDIDIRIPGVDVHFHNKKEKITTTTPKDDSSSSGSSSSSSASSNKNKHVAIGKWRDDRN